VTIHGGDIKVKTYRGACIGSGGAQSTPAGVKEAKGLITIDGGIIFADFSFGNAIGRGQDNNAVPVIHIDKKADIVAFGREISNFPGIDPGDNTTQDGNGYFVNGNFDHQNTVSADNLFIVFGKENTDIPVRVVPVDFPYKEFSFTTGEIIRKDYYIYIGTYSGGVKQVVCKGEPDDKPNHSEAEIFSVRNPSEYGSGGHYWKNYWRSMAVKYGDGGGFVFKFMVTEHYIDTSGRYLDEVDQNPRVEMVEINTYYTKFPAIPGYDSKGYKWDAKPNGVSDITEGNPNELIKGNREIYFVYALYVKPDLTISKMVTGDYANKTKEFKFTIIFTDSKGNYLKPGEKFEYEGGVITNSGATAPANKTLILDDYGKAVFTLSHGQTITIKEVSSDVKIQIIETKDNNYAASFTDSSTKIKIEKNDTTPLLMGDETRTFDFVNERIIAIPTNVDTGIWIPAALLTFTIMLILSGVIAVERMRKRKCVR
jgi:hypothetical protein